VPIYEFRCQECSKKFSTLIGTGAGPDDTACPHCHSRKTDKLVSKFARHRNEDDRIHVIADRLESMNEPETGADMREVVRELGKATDDDLSAELEEMFEADMEGTGDELD
jgi:putative FmdB family regulatory protein